MLKPMLASMSKSIASNLREEGEDIACIIDMYRLLMHMWFGTTIMERLQSVTRWPILAVAQADVHQSSVLYSKIL